MNKLYLNERDILYIFFIFVIIVGTLCLFMPFSWKIGFKPSFVDAMFTAVSAVCVTGLSTVDIVNMTIFGRIILLLLIQIGGLGLITFSYMFLALPRRKLTLANTKLIQSYFIKDRIIEPIHIIKIVLRFTLVLEFIGAIFLYFAFRKHSIDNSAFNAVFHSVSAFCNAGFSTLPNGLEIFRDDLFSNITFMTLIITGGLGFMVLMDIYHLFIGREVTLLLHTKIMLLSTAFLILVGGILFYIFEYNNIIYEGLTWNQKIIPSFFQSVTTRTAGFNTVDQSSLSLSSKALSIGFMFIGGGSGSTAGGIKVTTAFLLVCVLIQGLNDNKGVTIFNRKIDSSQLTRAGIFFGKAIVIVFFTILGLLITESFYGDKFSFIELAFESFSAIATVGLSLGITGELSLISKIILICTMFAGRIGLFALILPSNQIKISKNIEYPKGEVLIG